MKCPHCGGSTRSRIVEAYPYTESGLDRVTIRNLEERCCSTCNEQAIVVPKVTGLHRAIGVALATKPTLLTGKEIGFIRRLLGLSEAELALRIYASPQDVECWEREDIPSWAATDRLIRALFILKGKFEGFWTAMTYEQVDEMLANVSAQRAPQSRLEARLESETWGVHPQG